MFQECIVSCASDDFQIFMKPNLSLVLLDIAVAVKSGDEVSWYTAQLNDDAHKYSAIQK